MMFFGHSPTPPADSINCQCSYAIFQTTIARDKGGGGGGGAVGGPTKVPGERGGGGGVGSVGVPTNVPESVVR